MNIREHIGMSKMLLIIGIFYSIFNEFYKATEGESEYFDLVYNTVPYIMIFGSILYLIVLLLIDKSSPKEEKSQ